MANSVGFFGFCFFLLATHTQLRNVAKKFKAESGWEMEKNQHCEPEIALSTGIHSNT